MLAYDSAIEAQLESGKISFRDALRFDLGSGSYGFIIGYRGKIETGSVTYLGSGGLIGIEEPEARTDGSGQTLTVTLASHYKINGEWHQLLEPHLLTSIENEDWFRRPAIIYRFWFDSSRRLVVAEQRHLREIMEIEHAAGEVGRVIRGKLGTAADWARVVEGKLAGPDLQALIDPTDTSARHVAQAAVDKVYFGRRPPATV